MDEELLVECEVMVGARAASHSAKGFINAKVKASHTFLFRVTKIWCSSESHSVPVIVPRAARYSLERGSSRRAQLVVNIPSLPLTTTISSSA